jgi:hypothetical protein
LRRCDRAESGEVPEAVRAQSASKNFRVGYL